MTATRTMLRNSTPKACGSVQTKSNTLREAHTIGARARHYAVKQMTFKMHYICIWHRPNATLTDKTAHKHAALLVHTCLAAVQNE